MTRLPDEAATKVTTMKRKRRQFSSEYKARVALAALKEHQAIPELAARFEVHPNQLSAWKAELRERARLVFDHSLTAADPVAYVLTWALWNTLDSDFCVTAVTEALAQGGRPQGFNPDQGSQYPSEAFTGVLHRAGVQLSMDGRGRAPDNVFVERLWRSVKYEDIYLKRYETGRELVPGLAAYFRFYNEERPHQALTDHTPQAVYQAKERATCVLR